MSRLADQLPEYVLRAILLAGALLVVGVAGGHALEVNEATAALFSPGKLNLLDTFAAFAAVSGFSMGTLGLCVAMRGNQRADAMLEAPVGRRMLRWLISTTWACLAAGLSALVLLVFPGRPFQVLLLALGITAATATVAALFIFSLFYWPWARRLPE